MSRADENLLDNLHRMTGTVLLAELEAYATGQRIDADGMALSAPAALLTAAMKFLKDNGVDRAVKAGDTLDKLAAVLPTFDDVVTQFPGKRR